MSGDRSLGSVLTRNRGTMPQTELGRAIVKLREGRDLLLKARDRAEGDKKAGRALSVAITHAESAMLWAGEGEQGPGEGVL